MTGFNTNNTEKEKRERRGFRKYVPLPAFVLLCIFALALTVHLLSFASASFADFFNENISPVFRFVLAKATGWFPFSLAETVIISLPALIIVIFICFIQLASRDKVKSLRFIISLASAVTLMYSTFVLCYGVGYQNTPLDGKLGIERREVTAQQLYDTALEVNKGLTGVLDDVNFPLNSASVMPYDLDEMTSRLNGAYDKACDKYAFISRLHSRLKYIALSKPMTYTHISGVYSYYTGEANLNINFPDYTLPYTAAHELAHQRGIAPEDEANFVAFLVCMESDDAYIRYSGYQNMLEYLMSALYTADKDMYGELLGRLDPRSRCEISAYNAFFEPYRESLASDISSAINDTYLKSQGESAGERSYGMVVDLAVAYYSETE